MYKDVNRASTGAWETGGRIIPERSGDDPENVSP